MRPGLIASGYKDIINTFINELELNIINYLKELYNNNKDEVLGNTNNNLENKILDLTEHTNKDLNTLYTKVYNIFPINEFIINITTNLNEQNITEQYNIFKSFLNDKIINNKTTHDEMISIYNLLYNIKINKNINNKEDLSRQTSLLNNSIICIKSRKIISNTSLNSMQRQMLLETYLLNYEKDFKLNIIKNMDCELSDYKLLTRIFKHYRPKFKERITIFIENLF